MAGFMEICNSWLVASVRKTNVETCVAAVRKTSVADCVAAVRKTSLADCVAAVRKTNVAACVAAWTETSHGVLLLSPLIPLGMGNNQIRMAA